MACKRLKTDDMEVDYKFACRCCLKSEAEFFKLDALTQIGMGDNNENSTKIPLIRLLLYCLRTENLNELPQYICVDCSKSLQIAYLFLQNAHRAHEILCRKLCPGKMKTTTRFNGQQSLEFNRGNVKLDATNTKLSKASVRHECKICGAIIYNRLELKQHIRMHTEETRHSCKLCKFVTLKQRQLPEHYRKVHGLTAAQIDQQLKLRKSLQSAVPATNVTSKATKDTDDGQVKVCTLEDMELLIPTVLTPEDFSQPQLDADQLRDIEEQLANSLGVVQSDSSNVLPTDSTIAQDGSPNVSIGAEFLVMPDGSLQQVQDGGVVFEYIDDSKTSTTNATPNISLHNLLDDSKSDLTYSAMDIEMNRMVVEDSLPQITVKPKLRPGPGPITVMKYKCNLCPKIFPTVARLKSHQLTHSHLPKFYCDQCPYHSLRSSDLIQHYTDEHKSSIGDSKSHVEKSLHSLSTDRSRIYSCDMCLFETPSSAHLKSHYSDKHMIQPSNVQLRPSWTIDTKDKSGSPSNLPLGITYPSTNSVESVETTAKTESIAITKPTTRLQQIHPAQPTTTAVLTSTGDINVVVDATSLFYAAGVSPTTGTTTTTATTTTTSTEATVDVSDTFAIFPEQSKSLRATSKKAESSGLLPVSVSATAGNVAVGSTPNPNNSIFSDMQDFIDNTDVAAICTIPADDMPVVDGDDIVIDNNNMSLDFDAENLFDDFEEDVEVGEDEDEDDAENEDENDNNDAAADQNLLLTSDDDDVDDFDDEQSKNLQKPYCIYCNKKFTSQYKFENHMFVHRGLAPYRCELCTNLYNMKRLLIRHYKTVHKRMPTRDMVQAKGDKVAVERTAIEKLSMGADKPPMVMCAKCPFECELKDEMRKHLNAHHGINDGVAVHANEVFIIHKLPFECPRCIRSFAAKRTLTRHLQRSHLVDTIIEMQAPQLTTSSSETTTTSTATIALPKRAQSIVADTDADTDGDGYEKCADIVINSDTGIETDNDDIDIKSLTSTPTSGFGTITTTADTNDVNINKPTTAESSPVNPTSIITSESPTQPLTSATVIEKAQTTSTTTTTPETSTPFPTPTPFDFDLDFIENGAHGNPLNSNNENFNVLPITRQLLNGSDKLLTAALEPSPVKDLRSRLPQTPIFVCKQCNQTFDELNKMLQHELEQHSSGTVPPRNIYQHQCKVCNTTYRTVTLLNYHMKRHAPRKVPCKLCPKEFSSNSDLEQHVDSEHRTNMPLKCGINGCAKTFNYKHHLKRHQTASHTPVQYICPECGRDMLTSLHLRNHIKTHKGTHSYKCPKCVRTYMRLGPFQRHALREHGWDLSEDDINKMYSVNEPVPSMKTRMSLNVEKDTSD
ncbi:hypothetical protein KR044_005207 [Drosophila immigrans]|nr:hypothetical protein KR044_005207 [Drosophila immigrans]